MFKKTAEKIKSFYVPTFRNSLRPYSLRSKTLIAVGAIVVIVQFGFFSCIYSVYRPQSEFASAVSSVLPKIQTILPNVLVDETNAFRAKNNLDPLSINTTLAAAAQMKADDMAANGYFAHKDPEGRMPWYWMAQANYNFDYAGENLAVDFFDADAVVKAWINSPPHRANLLGIHFKEIGIGLSQGMYEGHNTTFVVQFFGDPVAADGVPLADQQSASVFSSIYYYIGNAIVFPASTVKIIMIVFAALGILFLTIPLVTIFLHHRSPSLYVKIRELYLLFKKQIIMSIALMLFIAIVTYINYVLLQTVISTPVHDAPVGLVN